MQDQNSQKNCTKDMLYPIEAKENLNNEYINANTYQERIILEVLRKLKNPFYNLSVKQVAQDLQIGENMAYEVFKREDFPSINIGRKWKISLIAYLIWKTQKRI